MTVLFCITDLNKGGAEKTLFTICTKTRIISPDFKPVVVSLIGGYYLEQLEKEGVTCFTIIVKKSILKSICNIFKSTKFLVNYKSKIQLIHGFMPYGCAVGLISQIIVRKPVIYAIRNSTMSGAGKANFLRDSIRKIIHLISLKTAQLITVNSPYVATSIKMKNGVNPTLVMNGIELPQEQLLNDENIKIKYFSGIPGFKLVCVCNMRYPQKDIPGLLNVAAKDKTIEYILVGSGKDLELFKLIAREKKLTNVTFTGFQCNVYAFINNADAFITLSRHEGFPNTVLEAMACKKPVIFSRIPEVEGVLKHEKNALLVSNDDPEDVYQAIIKIRNNYVLRRQIIENAYALVTEELSENQFLENNYKTYRTLLPDLNR